LKAVILQVAMCASVFKLVILNEAKKLRTRLRAENRELMAYN
jgi:hypothetical protein